MEGGKPAFSRSCFKYREVRQERLPKKKEQEARQGLELAWHAWSPGSIPSSTQTKHVSNPCKPSTPRGEAGTSVQGRLLGCRTFQGSLGSRRPCLRSGVGGQAFKALTPDQPHGTCLVSNSTLDSLMSPPWYFCQGQLVPLRQPSISCPRETEAEQLAQLIALSQLSEQLKEELQAGQWCDCHSHVCYGSHSCKYRAHTLSSRTPHHDYSWLVFSQTPRPRSTVSYGSNQDH